jgi:hypothetical protein
MVAFFIHMEAYCCDVARLCLCGTGLLMGLLSIAQMIYERLWSSVGMILTGENVRTPRKPVSVPLCPPQIPQGLIANPGLDGEKPATNRLSYDSAYTGPYKQNRRFGNVALSFAILYYTSGKQKFTFLSLYQSIFRAHLRPS